MLLVSSELSEIALSDSELLRWSCKTLLIFKKKSVILQPSYWRPFCLRPCSLAGVRPWSPQQCGRSRWTSFCEVCESGRMDALGLSWNFRFFSNIFINLQIGLYFENKVWKRWYFSLKSRLVRHGDHENDKFKGETGLERKNWKKMEHLLKRINFTRFDANNW